MVGIDNNLYSLMTEFASNSSKSDPFAEFRKSAETRGFTVQNFHNTKMTGVVATKHVNSLGGIPNFNSLNGRAVGQQGNGFAVTKKFFTTDYRLNTDIDLSNMANSSQEQLQELGNAILGSSNNMITLQLMLTLPFKAESNNASKVLDNGRTLVWNLIPGRTNPIQMAATMPNLLNIAVTILGLLIVIGGLSALWILRKRKAVSGSVAP
jgi:hypothetical protein